MVFYYILVTGLLRMLIGIILLICLILLAVFMVILMMSRKSIIFSFLWGLWYMIILILARIILINVKELL